MSRATPSPPLDLSVVRARADRLLADRRIAADPSFSRVLRDQLALCDEAVVLREQVDLLRDEVACTDADRRAQVERGDRYWREARDLREARQ